MSPCDPLFGPDRRVNGFVCTRGPRKGTRTPCAFCKKPGADLLCDGPGPTPRRTCDAKICRACAIGVRSLDADFCPTCAGKDTVTCPAGMGIRADSCSGPETKEGTCLKHAVIFDKWLRDLGGYRDVYSRDDLSREQKRLRFRTWLTTDDGQEQVAAFARRLTR